MNPYERGVSLSRVLYIYFIIHMFCRVAPNNEIFQKIKERIKIRWQEYTGGGNLSRQEENEKIFDWWGTGRPCPFLQRENHFAPL